MGAGGGFALWTYRSGMPKPVWVPLPLNPALTDEQREDAAAKLKAKLLEGDTLTNVVKELGLAAKLKLPTDEAAEAEVRRLLFVKPGEADSPMGRIPSINIGFESQRKTYDAYSEASMRLMKDVSKILGLKDPASETF